MPGRTILRVLVGVLAFIGLLSIVEVLVLGIFLLVTP